MASKNEFYTFEGERDSALFCTPSGQPRRPREVVGVRPLPREPLVDFFYEGKRVTDLMAQELGFAHSAGSMVRTSNPAQLVADYGVKLGSLDTLAYREAGVQLLSERQAANQTLHGRLVDLGGPSVLLLREGGAAVAVERHALVNLQRVANGSEVFVEFDSKGSGYARSPENQAKREVQKALVDLGLLDRAQAGRPLNVEVVPLDEATLEKKALAFSGVVLSSNSSGVSVLRAPEPGSSQLQLYVFPPHLAPGVAKGEVLEVQNEPQPGGFKFSKLVAQAAREVVQRVIQAVEKALDHSAGLGR